MSTDLPLDRRLRQEILRARERVYRFGQATPLERLEVPGVEVWVKREDLSPIKAYKWRGAANRMSVLTADERGRGVVTASAGNHAQGVALAAARLGIAARIHMPASTPAVKVAAVRKHGGDRVEIRLAGDSYDEAMAAALADARETGATYVHAYDDIHVMAGQATLADEVVLSGKGPFDAAYLQIGGGGMAAGASEWLKSYWPGIEIVGVEGEEQASMKAAIEGGGPVELEQLDIFCDGTAVRKAGATTYEVCRRTLDRLETVSNGEVVHAIRTLWEGLRCVSEPSGAMGLARVLREREALAGKRVLVVLCGANIDFLQLGQVASMASGPASHSRTVRVRIDERPGAMLDLLDSCFAGLNVADFQYGKVNESVAWPVFTLTEDAAGPLEELPARLERAGFEWEDASEAIDVRFRAVAMDAGLLRHPLFVRLEFYDRRGALHDFLAGTVRGGTSICYFNYRQSGERIGRALLGFDFAGEADRAAFREEMPARGEGFRLCEEVDEATSARMLGRG